jgi:hypothetical protein
MRAIRIGTEVIGVSSEVERAWQNLEHTAKEHAQLRGDTTPHIRFRTDTGVTGMLPVTAEVPIIIGDADLEEAGWRGTITAADGGSAVAQANQSPDEVNAEWPRRSVAD